VNKRLWFSSGKRGTKGTFIISANPSDFFGSLKRLKKENRIKKKFTLLLTKNNGHE
jgi:hypothetical protein